MDNSTYSDEYIQRYFDNELTSGEKAAFERDLSDNEQLQQIVESMRLARQLVIEQAIRAKVRHAHTKYTSAGDVPVRKLQRRSVLRFTVAVAAAAIILFAIVFGYNAMTVSSEKLYASHFMSFDRGTYRAASADDSSLLLRSYDREDFDAVIAAGKSSDSLSMQESFVTGMAYLERNEPSSAASLFDRVVSGSEPQSFLALASEYYLGLSYLRMKQYDRALEYFQKIRDNDQHPYHGKVSRSLLRNTRILKWRS